MAKNRLPVSEIADKTITPLDTVTGLASNESFFSLCSEQTQFIIAAQIGMRPRIVYFGRRLRDTDAQELVLLATRQWTHGSISVDFKPSLSNELSSGLCVPPGFIAHRKGEDWCAFFLTQEVEQKDGHSLIVKCRDENIQIGVDYHFHLDPETQILSTKSVVTNFTANVLDVDWCSALCMPLDERFTRLLNFTGRWSLEFQRDNIEKFQGGFLRENRRGRTSHDTFPGLLVTGDTTNENSGTAAGFHFGWSGNSRLRVDQSPDGHAFLQMGELFHPNEMELAEHESYETPTLFAAWSEEGLNGVSKQFHDHVLTRILGESTVNKPRPVHYNSWEAIYFDHDEEKIKDLAKLAADMGAERFILDDGWFGGRRCDSAGLGDWWVSKEVYPKGLGPLVQHVKKLGMEMGIWFEPEMVNPDSDLFRAHPNWVLGTDHVEQIPFRNQYVLNLTKVEVFDYLFDKMSAIINELEIDYIKWDMNRDVHHPSPSGGGRGLINRQTKAVYALMSKLKTHYPTLEIESCSSGGGRCDFEILKRSDRLWVSDSNDALDRQNIQRGASYFFPLSIMGAHVGPRQCHITQRELSMEFRAATAIFGHMGMELDLFEESKSDLEILKAAIALHKDHRQLIHSGQFVRLETSATANAIGVVARDRGEALFSYAKLESDARTLPGRLRLEGLDMAKRYRIRQIWPNRNVATTTPSIIDEANLLGDGTVFSGEALILHGIQLPLLYPQAALIYHLTMVTE